MTYLMAQNVIQRQETKCPQMNVPSRGLIHIFWAGGVQGKQGQGGREKEAVCVGHWIFL
jgi:hypothetical protein